MGSMTQGPSLPPIRPIAELGQLFSRSHGKIPRPALTLKRFPHTVLAAQGKRLYQYSYFLYVFRVLSYQSRKILSSKDRPSKLQRSHPSRLACTQKRVMMRDPGARRGRLPNDHSLPPEEEVPLFHRLPRLWDSVCRTGIPAVHRWGWAPHLSE